MSSKWPVKLTCNDNSSNYTEKFLQCVVFTFRNHLLFFLRGGGQCLLVQADLNPAAEDDFGFLVLLSVPAGTKGCSL